MYFLDELEDLDDVARRRRDSTTRRLLRDLFRGLFGAFAERTPTLTDRDMSPAGSYTRTGRVRLLVLRVGARLTRLRRR